MDRFGLQCFVALAEELHFHRAAERCHISQPAMSQQIVRLERELDVRLAHRSKRSVALTRAGRSSSSRPGARCGRWTSR
ncbi:LysR family transcriptional regulator [Pseudonocardia benzenivorans]